ncbi:hypothetical protein THRCLA_09490 [Thraustotheca clavata]|uniref:Bzip transcription factor n=1 Tax=Thraustotheca clavata TaxID=74557 RepID=A0A1V9YWG8_9STRA|nr:hypothetical protein THRCLA_09490 [Thraustotheca clavata]
MVIPRRNTSDDDMKILQRLQARANQRRRKFLPLQSLNQEHTSEETQYDCTTLCRSAGQPVYPLNVAAEYFRIFRHGYQAHNKANGDYQFGFLKSTFSPDVMFMGQTGINKVYEQGQLYHSLFHSLEMTCSGFEVVDQNECTTIRAPAKMHLRISRKTIETLYPHIVHNKHLVQRLVGQVWNVPVLINFRCDNEGRVLELDTVADMTPGLLHILGNADDTQFVLGASHITPKAELLIKYEENWVKVWFINHFDMPAQTAETRKSRRRVQSRHNQRRYRQQYRDNVADLEKDVRDLETVVARYDGQLSALRSAIRLHEPEINVAAEYFRIFRHSYQRAIPSQAQYQCDFMHSAMDPDILFMGQIGIKKVFEQWTLYHSLFHSFEMTCAGLDVLVVDGGTIVRAPSQMDLRISRQTIEALYPHVLQNERIVQKLIGRILRMPVLIHFRYDETDRMVELDTSADMTTGLIEILESIEDTVTVLSHGRINDKAEIKAPEVFYSIGKWFIGIKSLTATTVVNSAVIFCCAMPKVRESKEAREKRLVRCRVNQKRYRAKKKQTNTQIIKEVPELAKYVARLEGQLDVLRASTRLNNPEVSVAAEYFRIFQYSHQRNVQQQFEFLTSSMDPNLKFMGQVGINKLLDQWTLYHTLFHSFEMTCPAFQVLYIENNKVVRAPAIMDLRISRTTLEALYPHVLHDERLVQKLIGKVLRMAVLIHLHYDENSRVVEFATAADMTVGWSNLLESLDDTLTVLGGARIRHDAELGAEGVVVQATYYLRNAENHKKLQLDFLSSTMHREIVFMEQVGIEKVFEQYELYHLVFAAFDITYKNLEVIKLDNTTIVRVPATIDLLLSEKTLEHLYPHVLSNLSITKKMVSQRLHLPVLMYFHFDQFGKIIELTTHTNLTSSLFELLGNVGETLIATEGAKIT